MTAVPRKQVSAQADWLSAWENAEALCPAPQLDALISRTLAEMEGKFAGQRVAYAWSGGKDSLVIDWLCAQLGVTSCVFAMTNLEYPEFLAWVTNHMPPGLSTINTGQDLAWLAKNPKLLFPQTAADNARWFRLVQHAAQAQYFHRWKLGLLVLGRRHAEGNHCGPNGVYTNREGVTRYSPIRDWPHEAVLALLRREGYSLPPIYGYPRGWQVGTGNWAQRLYTGSREQGWDETWQIDPQIVRQAAEVLPQVRAYLAQRGLS
ncbi:3'-phosphoadenosine 5'-phosphosulfate sulfotransferase (PAPS reductase)/FAD synthetase [Deinococcus reticulitermitis]|uniref:3'-phosphoadenosine 5'-phosphosulfate sulfotransferase (PAPS reductase)/FAD synthetase n=1 Tax=Deinococcus reticulitermitis TaxID=856736 RepID=A0A1H6SHU1_9DEIO|nr:phosphoadenosine phosphosulfate reductase family protein [Deinococcus reticulitermitis]SEI67519.1 3'-phosphoadenosine 5'-phosphosulfate sulfotransferase (PAPS reductase)/FAD synthetase [Deinococcus reticulitermitis]